MEISRDGGIATKFVSEPSPHLKCPVCKTIYKEPVINIKCGHTFCQSCAYASNYCPIDQQHCDTSQLVVNRLVVGQIDDLQIYCQHGLVTESGGTLVIDPSSCSEIISIGKRNEHEASCVFAYVSCPNSEACPKIRRKDLENHKKVCNKIKCSFAKHGCTYYGTKERIQEHFEICLYRRGSPSNGNLATRVAEQEMAMQALQAENVQLTKKVAEMEESISHMAAQILEQGNKLQELEGNNKLQELEHKFNRLSLQLESAINPSTPRRVISASQISLAEGGASDTGRRSSSSHRSLSPGRHYEKWEEPFQFKCIGTFRGHKDIVWVMTSRKGHLYSGGANGQIRIWSLQQLAKGCVGTISAHNGVIHCLAMWGNVLVSAGEDKSIAFWDIETNTKKTSILAAHEDTICSMVICNDLMFTSSFAVIKIWDLKNMETKACLKNINHWVRAMAVSRGKDKLYSGTHNAINIWNIQDNFEKVGSIELECGSVYSLAVTKNYIIAGSSGNYDKYIQVFNIDTLEFVMNLNGHMGTVTTLVASPSGQYLFSASHDSTIQMWGLEFLLPIQPLSRHQGSVNTLTLHGDFLLSGSADHEIKVFRYFKRY